MSDLAKIGKQFRAATERRKAISVELHAAIRAAVADGMSESEAARVAGVDRMTVRRALGKL
jgi:DNA invertase Pin-like site-specific DNA recombinase